jgi:NADH-quinone oxidoreductase subunit C
VTTPTEVAGAGHEIATGLGGEVTVSYGEVSVRVPRERLVEALRICRDQRRFEMCLGLTAVHYPTDAGAELHAVYELLSMTHNQRLRLEVSAPDADPHLPSGVGVYPTLDWHEREAWDMVGLIFDGHPALTRILMPDDWPGHPQRKDEALGGVPVEYHGASVPPPDQRRAFR